MRIGLVCPYDLSIPGGVQAQVIGLRNSLIQLGDEVIVIGPGLPADIPGVDLGATVTIAGNRSRAPISLDPRIGRKLSNAEIDVLHVHEPLMPVASWAALRLGTPVVATFHASPEGIYRLFYKAAAPWLRRLLGPNVRSVTSVSKSAGLPLGDLDHQIIPNGVDVSQFERDIAKVPGRVAFLGRDEPRKGLDVLLGSWPTVSGTSPGAELVVMGASREVEGVTWLGRVDDDVKADVLASSSVFVAPNTGGESFGIVLVEAMAAGAAVVAADLPAFQDVGGDAISYFESGSSRHLTRVMTDLLRSPDEVSRLSKVGRQRADLYDWSTVTAKYRDLYARAVS